MIRLDKLSVRRGRHTVLHDVSAEIPAAKVTVVIGRSGAGKSTLIGTLNGLFRPSSGSIATRDMGSLQTRRDWREFRRRTATVFQEHALIDRLSAIDNVLLGLADRRHPLSPLPWSKELRCRAAQALDEVGLLHSATARADRLSGGERQRVGIARALVREPHLLLADEPFASVDPALVRQLSHVVLSRVRFRRMTAVLVMHQIDTALALADHVIALAGGRVAFAGAPEVFDGRHRERVFDSAERPDPAGTPGSPAVSPESVPAIESLGAAKCYA